jgi:hypothetical protein
MQVQLTPARLSERTMVLDPVRLGWRLQFGRISLCNCVPFQELAEPTKGADILLRT